MEKNYDFENPIEMVNQTIRDFKELCRLTGVGLEDLSLKKISLHAWEIWHDLEDIENFNLKALEKKYKDNPEKMNQIIRFYRNAVYLNLLRLQKALSN